MADYMKVGPDGAPHLDFSALSRGPAAALVALTVEEFTVGAGEDAAPVRKVKFKLADKTERPPPSSSLDHIVTVVEAIPSTALA